MGSVASSLLTSKDLPLPGFIGVGGTAQRIGPGFLGMNYAPFTVQNAGPAPGQHQGPPTASQGHVRTPAPPAAPLLHRRGQLRQHQFPHILEKVNKVAAEKQLSTKERDKMLEAEREALASTLPGTRDDLLQGVRPDRVASEDRLRGPQRAEEGHRRVRRHEQRLRHGLPAGPQAGGEGRHLRRGGPGRLDMHANVFNSIRTGNGPRLDKGMGSLVKDLVERGMWNNTVVLWMGEFGRTPRINQKHRPRSLGAVLVGGGRRRRHQGRPGLRLDERRRHRHRQGRMLDRRPVRDGLRRPGLKPDAQDSRQPRPAAAHRRRQAAGRADLTTVI